MNDKIKDAASEFVKVWKVNVDDRSYEETCSAAEPFKKTEYTPWDYCTPNGSIEGLSTRYLVEGLMVKVESMEKEIEKLKSKSK